LSFLELLPPWLPSTRDLISTTLPALNSLLNLASTTLLTPAAPTNNSPSFNPTLTTKTPSLLTVFLLLKVKSPLLPPTRNTPSLKQAADFYYSNMICLELLDIKLRISCMYLLKNIMCINNNKNNFFQSFLLERSIKISTIPNMF